MPGWIFGLFSMYIDNISVNIYTSYYDRELAIKSDCKYGYQTKSTDHHAAVVECVSS